MNASALSAGLSAYVHIPFCSVRCGYCDFNTYTNLNFPGGASAARFADTLMREIDYSAEILAHLHAKEPLHNNEPLLNTAFFGGGTPTLLPARDLARILAHLRETFGIKPGAEITAEANPESATPETLETLASAGFTRISFGMQSAVERILRTLERHHTPGQVASVTAHARSLGLDYSLDLIYGTPGETLDDWKRSLDAAIELEPSHISAYALTLEPHVPMGRKIARGELADIDPDEQADKYAIAEQRLSAAGYRWYEISNWAKPGHESRHNLTYWREGNWWGYGPGAHSHVNGIRWWNVKHPLAYAQALHVDPGSGKASSEDFSAGNLSTGDLSPFCCFAERLSARLSSSVALPIEDFEVLTPAEIREERIMLGIRLREGISIPASTPPATIDGFVTDGLLDRDAARSGRLVLTVRGRLLADTVIRALW